MDKDGRVAIALNARTHSANESQNGAGVVLSIGQLRAAIFRPLSEMQLRDRAVRPRRLLGIIKLIERLMTLI